MVGLLGSAVAGVCSGELHAMVATMAKVASIATTALCIRVNPSPSSFFPALVWETILFGWVVFRAGRLTFPGVVLPCCCRHLVDFGHLCRIRLSFLLRELGGFRWTRWAIGSPRWRCGVPCRMARLAACTSLVIGRSQTWRRVVYYSLLCPFVDDWLPDAGECSVDEVCQYVGRDVEWVHALLVQVVIGFLVGTCGIGKSRPTPHAGGILVRPPYWVGLFK